jgi:hypothetical protein
MTNDATRASADALPEMTFETEAAKEKIRKLNGLSRSDSKSYIGECIAISIAEKTQSDIAEMIRRFEDNEECAAYGIHCIFIARSALNERLRTVTDAIRRLVDTSTTRRVEGGAA